MLTGRIGLAALRCTGLAGDRHRIAGNFVADGAGHLLHALPHQLKGVAGAFDHIHDLGLGLAEHLAGVGVQNGLDEMGAVTGAVVGQRCRVGSQLDGRDHRVALTDGGLHIQRCHIVGVALGGQTAHGLAHLHTGALAKTQLVGIGIVHIAGQAAANIIEEDVAAPLDGRYHIDVAAVAMAGTAGVVILEVVVHAVAVNGRILIDEAAVQCSHRHGRLEGRTRRIQALQCAVEQRQARVGAVLAVVSGIQVLVIAGIVGSSQHTAVLHVQHHHRTGGSFHGAGIVYAVDHINVVRQCLVHGTLEVAVNGQLHGMARLRHSGELCIHDHAVRIAGDGLHAVLAAQLVLINGFQTRNAQNIVHVIAFFPQRIGHLTVGIGHLPLFRRDLAHTAQHRRDDIALVVAAGAGLHDLHTRQLQAVLLDGGHREGAHVLRHDKIVHIGERLPIHLVVDAGQHTLPFRRKILQIVLFHQHFHYIVGGGVLLQTKRFLHVCQLLLVAGGRVIVRKGVIACCVRLTDQQRIIPALAIRTQQLHDLLQHGVQIPVAHQQFVEDHIVAGGCGGNAPPGAVHDIAAGRRDRKVIVGGVGGLGLEVVAVDQLQKDQPHHVQAHDNTCHCNEQDHPAHNGFSFVLVHPRFLRRFRLRRCRF